MNISKDTTKKGIFQYINFSQYNQYIPVHLSIAGQPVAMLENYL